MQKSDLQVLEVKGQRVLTSRQIAKEYEVKEQQISQNFKNNKTKFIKGKHYILLLGEELKVFKNHFEKIEVVDKRAPHLYLWTEKGALLHAKSLNTDKAWEVYEYLLDFYFRAKETQQQQTPKGKQVVDIPTNEKAQSLIMELRKDIAGLDALISLYNRYQSEEDYAKIAYTVGQMGGNVANTAFLISLLKPKNIEKVW